ncbi:hypothetical protein V6U89_16855 [Micromonospora sp. CPCC 206171]|uniref:hypothetical protein n=1 Tax=Micromonospora sp. CPCC 206171 TaxID=3122405 RepID=UPI002FF0E388
MGTVERRPAAYGGVQRAFEAMALPERRWRTVRWGTVPRAWTSTFQKIVQALRGKPVPRLPIAFLSDAPASWPVHGDDRRFA